MGRHNGQQCRVVKLWYALILNGVAYSAAKIESRKNMRILVLRWLQIASVLMAGVRNRETDCSHASAPIGCVLKQGATAMFEQLVEDLERLHLRIRVESERALSDRDLAKRLNHLALESEDILEKAKSLVSETAYA